MDFESRIVEVIREGEIVRMPESQALDEDLFILRRIIEPEKERIAEFDISRSMKYKIEGQTKSYSRLEKWKAGKKGYEVNNVVKDLIDNFHWEIARGRRRKDITRKELADAIGIVEEDVKKIEFGELPRDDFVLINKIEGYLGISLRKEKKPEGPTLSQLQEMKEDKVREKIEKVQEEGKKRFIGGDIEILE